MNYIEVNFEIKPFEPWADLLAAELGEIGFESFVEQEPNTLLAYVTQDQFSEEKIREVDTLQSAEVEVKFTWKELVQQNWNKEWEANFDPVFVDDEICVRATFHEDQPNFKYQIVIDPKMSFGTGHHATTHLMLSSMRAIDFTGKSVLDMGSGTGVLAIFAAMKGAERIEAIDIDEWCSINAKENAERNHVPQIVIKQGGKEAIGDLKVDVLLANINRNILIDQFADYARVTKSGGELHISGFYGTDVPVLNEAAEKHGFVFESKNELNKWTTVKYLKQ
jgi:ribosomal protein L11 methyltransferase